MKTLTQVVLPIVLVAALIGGVSFFSQYTVAPPPPKTPPKTAHSPTAKANLPPLRIPVSTIVWDESDPFYAREFEQGANYFQDFWIANVRPTPAHLTVSAKSCTCAQLDIGLVPSESVRTALRLATPLTVARNLVGGLGFDPTPLVWTAPARSVTFRTVQVMDTVFTIPPADAATGVQFAVIRMNWEVKEPGPKRLTADVHYRHPDGTAGTSKFEVPTVGVPPILCAPPNVTVGEVRPGDRREFEVYFWSATRDEFPLTLDPSRDHPCIRFEKPEPLSRSDCERLPAVLAELHSRAVPTRVKSAYRAKLIVEERAEDRQLDLGPIEQRLVANKGRGDLEAPIYLTGFVRGDLRVGGVGDKDRVNLGEFRSDRPHAKTVVLTSEKPGTQLAVESTAPQGLSATLREKPTAAGLWQWELRVEVAPNTTAGPLPSNSAVILRTRSEPPRRIRVPVVGTAYLP